VLLIVQFFWFFLAPSPAFTDYVFAIRHDYPLEHVVSAFILSHVLIRIPQWLTIWWAVKVEDSSIYFKKKVQRIGELTGGDETENEI
jgi:hypothetical protein